MKRFFVPLAVLLCLPVAALRAEILPARGLIDGRVRAAVYESEQVYRLHGYVGYQIDLQFAAGEAFLGLGAGDIEGLSYVGEGNHLFLKPKAAKVATNLTVLTNRRHYQFDYTASAAVPAVDDPRVLYVLRFTYPDDLVPKPGDISAQEVDARLRRESADRPTNVDYWYCGETSLKPIAASDDGVHTRLRFAAQAELPTIFVRNDDDSESLLNFSMDEGDVIVHRVARRFVLRRGKLTGCIVNQGYRGGGTRLESGTVTPGVERARQGVSP
jgi:type IV secretion system protein VirB9